MGTINEITEVDFLNLSFEEIRNIVDVKKKPEVGIYILDGNRRAAMTYSKTIQNSDDFYMEYVNLFQKHIVDNLKIFFNHGLKVLFFPLLGPSYFHRSEKYKVLAILKLLEIFFRDKNILDFYRFYDVKIKIYGETFNIRKIAGLDMKKSIMELEDSTSCHKRHTIYYGIFSSTDFSLEFAKKIVRFYEQNKREPSHQEKVNLYYGENINTADFLITSTKMSVFGALPPLVYGKQTEMYFFVAPSIFSLTQKTYRKILYDLLFTKPNSSSILEYSIDDLESIDKLDEFYRNHNSMVIGKGKNIGRFWVPDFVNYT